MGQIQSIQKKQITIKKKQYNDREVVIPFSKLEMIMILQKAFNHEVKGTLYFDDSYKFRSFEVRTDNSEIYSTGASDWRISYHTHPDNTAQKYGLRYYSPPSVDDVMEILDRTMQFVPESVHNKLGEISIIFANEGIYILQADRRLFKQSILNDMSDEDMESYLQVKFNEFIIKFVKSGILALDPKANLDNPNISETQFYQILYDLSTEVSHKFGFIMKFHSWDLLRKVGLVLNTSDYFISTLDD